MSLYVHIPFCRSLCYYCGCHKIVTRNDERVESLPKDGPDCSLAEVTERNSPWTPLYDYYASP